MATKIEWTDETWNPIRGCSRVSEGCRNCYAEKVAYRFSGPGQPYEGLVQMKVHPLSGASKRLPLWNGQIKFVEEHLLDPLRWKKPRRIFVNSMSDLFHENVTDAMRDRIVAVAAMTPWHTMQCLTKRPEESLRYWTDPQLAGRLQAVIVLMIESGAVNTDHLLRMSEWHKEHTLPGNPFTPSLPLRNWQQGVSVEDQKTADERIPLLLQTPAAVRFISAEPLLGAIDFYAVDIERPKWREESGLSEDVYLDWVICGGESGPGARPMHPDWARSLRDQCEAAGVPFFFKQWGEWFGWRGDWNQTPIFKKTKLGVRWPIHVWPLEDRPEIHEWASTRAGKKLAGHLLDGKEYHQFPKTEGTHA